MPPPHCKKYKKVAALLDKKLELYVHNRDNLTFGQEVDELDPDASTFNMV